MKDRDLRQVVSLLSKRINYLNDELKRLKNPHCEDCKCNLCTGWRSNPFTMAFTTSKKGFTAGGVEEMNRLLKGE